MFCRSTSVFVVLAGLVAAWAGLRPTGGGDDAVGGGRQVEPGVFEVVLADDGFKPGDRDVDFGPIPAGSDLPTLRFALRNDQARVVRVFGNTSTCNEHGCSRTTIAEAQVEPGRVLRFTVEPSFKTGNILKAEATILAGSDRLFEWKITMHGERIAATRVLPGDAR